MEAYKDTDPIVLVFGSDNGYVKQLAVAIYTCTSNIYQGHTLDIHIMSNVTEKENRIRINKVVKSKNKNQLTCYDGHNFVKNIPVTNKLLNKSEYIPFYITYVLKSGVEHCIYLDCDIIVNYDISKNRKLRDDDISKQAVHDQRIPTVSSKSGLQNYAELDLSPEDPYFNSSVLLINLKAWRQKHVREEARHYLLNHHEHMVYADQEVLNALLAHDWKALDPRWNVHHHIDAPGWEQASRAWSYGPFKKDLTVYTRSSAQYCRRSILLQARINHGRTHIAIQRDCGGFATCGRAVGSHRLSAYSRWLGFIPYGRLTLCASAVVHTSMNTGNAFGSVSATAGRLQ